LALGRATPLSTMTPLTPLTPPPLVAPYRQRRASASLQTILCHASMVGGGPNIAATAMAAVRQRSTVCKVVMAPFRYAIGLHMRLVRDKV